MTFWRTSRSNWLSTAASLHVWPNVEICVRGARAPEGAHSWPHSSIPKLFTHSLLHSGCEALLESIPAVTGRRQVHPGQVSSSWQVHTERQTTICMLLDCGRKPWNPARTHEDTGRTCRLQTVPEIEPTTLLLWVDSGNHCHHCLAWAQFNAL